MKAQMVNYSNAFPNVEWAQEWAANQLPLVARHGSKLYIEKRATPYKCYYYVWRTLTARDQMPRFRDHQGGWLPIVDWLRLGSTETQINSLRVMDTADLMEVSA